MGIAERKAREKRYRTRQILDAAYEVFHEVGYSSATIDQIAERAELAKGTIYLYFKSKEELYFSLLVNGLDILIDLLSRMAEKRPPPDQLLRQTAKTLFQFYTDYTDYFRIFMMMRQEEMQAKLPPELSEQINTRATEILTLLSREMDVLVDGGIYAEVNTWQLANILWGAFTGITQLALTKEQLNVRTRHIDRMLSFCFELIHQGLCNDTGQPPNGKVKSSPRTKNRKRKAS